MQAVAVAHASGFSAGQWAVAVLFWLAVLVVAALVVRWLLRRARPRPVDLAEEETPVDP